MTLKARLKKIEFIEGESYLIVVSHGDSEIATICHVKNNGGADEKNFHYINFDSDEFKKKIMLGEILVREFSSAILEFHKHIQSSLNDSS